MGDDLGRKEQSKPNQKTPTTLKMRGRIYNSVHSQVSLFRRGCLNDFELLCLVSMFDLVELEKNLLFT